MIKNIPIEKVLFLDIETVPQVRILQNFLKPNKNFGIKKLQDKEKKIFLPKIFMEIEQE
jgi:hypothetical protein